LTELNNKQSQSHFTLGGIARSLGLRVWRQISMQILTWSFDLQASNIFFGWKTAGYLPNSVLLGATRAFLPKASYSVQRF